MDTCGATLFYSPPREHAGRLPRGTTSTPGPLPTRGMLHGTRIRPAPPRKPSRDAGRQEDAVRAWLAPGHLLPPKTGDGEGPTGKPRAGTADLLNSQVQPLENRARPGQATCNRGKPRRKATLRRLRSTSGVRGLCRFARSTLPRLGLFVKGDSRPLGIYPRQFCAERPSPTPAAPVGPLPPLKIGSDPLHIVAAQRTVQQ
jgi:hypothetical protein